MDLGISGLASNFDWRTLVDKLVEVERLPQNRLLLEQIGLQDRKTAYGSIQTQLGVLRNRVTALMEADFFDSRLAKVSDPTAATATAAEGVPAGDYAFNVTQFAAAAIQQGQNNAGAALNATNDVSGLVLANAGLGTAITAGVFSVNGNQVTIATSDTLQQVFDKINAATSGAVTGSYDSATDKITLSSGSVITLGTSTDTSNFLQATKLNNNGTGTVASSAALGAIRQSAALASANFSTAVSDGGSGAGQFKINGVAISFNATTDTVSNVLTRINESAAGVIASYNAENDRFNLTNKSTGDVGIALQDVTGNFLAATKLSSGTLQRGKDLLYSVNGGPTLTSRGNTITAESSGIQGLTVDVSKPQAAAGAGSTTTTTSVSTITTTGGTSGAGAEIISVFGGTGSNSTKLTTASVNSFSTGDTVRLQSTGTLPSMVNSTTTYYARSASTTTITLHPTLNDALNNTNAVNFGDNPPYTGNAYVVPYDPLATPPTTTSTTTTTTTTTTGESGGSVSNFTVSITNDSAKIKTAINEFLSEYNKTQTLIDTQTASSTDAKGKVTAGILANDSDASEIATRLRSTVYSEATGLAGTLKHLAGLGIDSNGNDNTLLLADGDKLDAALATNLSGVKDLFTNSAEGIAIKLDSYLESTIGDEGTVVAKQGNLTIQASAIDTQISELERVVQSNRERMIASFIAMEEAQAKINQQLQFLQQRLGLSSTSA